MHPYDLHPSMLVKKSPFLVVKQLGMNRARVYSRLHGNLTTFAIDIDAVLKLFDLPMDRERAINKVSRIYQVDAAEIIQELCAQRFLVDAGQHTNSLLAEYFQKVKTGTEIPKISKVVFLISEACNMACKGCYHNFYTFKNSRMSSELAGHILKGLFPYLKKLGISVLHIAFLGYEPLLNFETLQMIYDLAERMGEDNDIKTRFKIYTNGFQISEHIYDWIWRKRANLGIKVSLDGIRSDNDKRRVDFTGRGCHDRVFENLRRMLQRDIECSVLTVLSKSNLSNLEKFVDEMAAIGISRITANLFCGQSKEERLLELTDLEKIEAIKRMDLATETYGIAFDGEWKYAVLQMVNGTQFSCPAGMQQLVFSGDGDIYPCQRFAGTGMHFGNYTIAFWEALLNQQCESYNKWHAQLHSGLEEITAKPMDLTGWGCPFLPFLRGECLNKNLEKDLNYYLLDYFITRPMNRIKKI